MKRLLSLALFGVLAAAGASAQTNNIGRPAERGVLQRPGTGQQHAPPITNPEPITLVALAGGAAVAGGLMRRRKQANKQAK